MNASSSNTASNVPDPTPVWDYETTKNDLTDVTTKSGCLDSTNHVDFNFPYQGGSTGKLCFRRRSGKSLDGFFEVSKGQFLCSFEGCSVSVRIDDGPVLHYRMVGTNDDRSDVIFFESPAGLVRKLRSGARLRIEARFYQEGDRTFDFSPSTFDAARLN